MKGAMESLSSSSVGEVEEVDERLIKILEGLWGSYGCKTPPLAWRSGSGSEGRIGVEKGLRSLANGLEVSVCYGLCSLSFCFYDQNGKKADE
jgi:hypothetical protein